MFPEVDHADQHKATGMSGTQIFWGTSRKSTRHNRPSKCYTISRQVFTGFTTPSTPEAGPSPCQFSTHPTIGIHLEIFVEIRPQLSESTGRRSETGRPTDRPTASHNVC